MKSNVRWNFTLDGKKDFLYDESRTIRPGTLIKKVLSISYFLNCLNGQMLKCFASEQLISMVGREIKAACC